MVLPLLHAAAALRPPRSKPVTAQSIACQIVKQAPVLDNATAMICLFRWLSSAVAQQLQQQQQARNVNNLPANQIKPPHPPAPKQPPAGESRSISSPISSRVSLPPYPARHVQADASLAAIPPQSLSATGEPEKPSTAPAKEGEKAALPRRPLPSPPTEKSSDSSSAPDNRFNIQENDSGSRGVETVEWSPTPNESGE